MPDKRYVKGCGKSCVRCWVNRQIHGSKLKRKNFPKKFEDLEKDEDEDEKNYISIFEEFLDKFCVSSYTMERIYEINESDFNAKEHNNNLIKKTTNAYNDWVLKEKDLDKKIKEKDLIKTMNDEYKNSDILEGTSVSTYPCEDVADSEKFYMFECIY